MGGPAVTVPALGQPPDYDHGQGRGAPPRWPAARRRRWRMGVMDRFERRLDRLVNGVFAKTFKARGRAGGDRRRPSARVRRPGGDRQPRTHDGAQRVHGRARALRPRAALGLCRRPWATSSRPWCASTPRSAASPSSVPWRSASHAPTTSTRDSSASAARPRPGSPTDRRPPLGRHRRWPLISRSATGWSRSPDAPRCWAGATTPICASTILASRASTRRSCSVTPAAWSTSPRPTAPGSTVVR